MKIDNIDLKTLKNEDHFQFHTNFLDQVNKTGALEIKINHQFDAYVPLFHAMDAAYKKTRKSIYTEQIREADKARDKVWQSYVGACKAALKHFDPNVQMSAKKLKILNDTYGKVDKKTLLGQTAATYNILQDLTGAYSADVTRLGVTPLVEELQNLNSRCNDLMNDRADEEAAKNNTVYVEARANIDNAYLAIRERINALVVVEGAADYEAFIRTWNVHVAKFVAILKGKRRNGSGASDGGDSQDDGTDEQQELNT